MMPPMKIFPLLFFTWAAFPCTLQAQEKPQGESPWPRCAPARSGSHILFLGNSYTFFNRMPAMVKAMADTKGLRPDVHMHAAPAASFQSHWNDGRAREKLEGTAWDFVILQDQSATPVVAPERTMEFGGKWCSQVRAAQGTPVLMLTWGRKDASGVPDPQEQKALLATYLNLARKEKAAVAPVGIAWENCLKRHPGIALYQADGQHPTEGGKLPGGLRDVLHPVRKVSAGPPGQTVPERSAAVQPSRRAGPNTANRRQGYVQTALFLFCRKPPRSRRAIGRRSAAA